MSKSKSKKKTSIIDGKYYPLVSVCTPTFNRRPFIPIMFECFRNQTYPKHRIEWIIVDDGTDKIKDLVDQANIPQIKYFSLPKKMNLGEKRNYMHSQSTGSIIVYMDDDDYYPPERISHSVERLTENKTALCAGSSEIYIYFKHIGKMYQCGPYSPTHATAGTFAFKRELLEQTKYEDHASLAEEKYFLKDYTIPFVQLDPMKTILVFSHIHNTFDKRKLLENPHPQFCKESPKTVDHFIRKSNESNIKRFFMQEIEELLNNYSFGEPKNKPDVISQLKQIEKERAQSMNSEAKIMLASPGKPPVELGINDVLAIINQQQEYIANVNKIIAEKDAMIAEKERLLKLKNTEIEKKNKQIETLLKTTKSPETKPEKQEIFISNPFPSVPLVISEPSKTTPERKINVSD
jgi:glycosyltransferase involved in cell wall biosynthesis